MSILKYFHPTKEKLELLDPNGSLSGSMPSLASCIASEWQGEGCTQKQMSTGSWGPYLTLTPAQKYQIGKRAAECGAMAAIWYCQKKFSDLPLKETERVMEFLFCKEAQFHPLLRSIFLYMWYPCTTVSIENVNAIGLPSCQYMS